MKVERRQEILKLTAGYGRAGVVAPQTGADDRENVLKDGVTLGVIAPYAGANDRLFAIRRVVIAGVVAP